MAGALVLVSLAMAAASASAGPTIQVSGHALPSGLSGGSPFDDLKLLVRVLFVVGEDSSLPPQTSSAATPMPSKLSRGEQHVRAAELGVSLPVLPDELTALPVAYDKSTPSAEWEPFARLVLRAAYDATLAAAACKSAAEGGRRVRVFLTALGGGAFGNRAAWIVDALQAALEAHREQPLDVALVHYGSAVRSEWAGLGIG